MLPPRRLSVCKAALSRRKATRKKRLLILILLVMILVRCGDLLDRMVDRFGTVLVPMPAGVFQMGSSDPGNVSWEDEKPRHLVKYHERFHSSAYKATQEQYERVMGSNLSESKGRNKPFEKLSWNEAVEFWRKLSDQEGMEYRLPNADEWEFVRHQPKCYKRHRADGHI